MQKENFQLKLIKALFSNRTINVLLKLGSSKTLNKKQISLVKTLKKNDNDRAIKIESRQK